MPPFPVLPIQMASQPLISADETTVASQRSSITINSRLGAGSSNNSQWTFPAPLEIENYENTNSDVNLAMSADGNILIIGETGTDEQETVSLFIFLQVLLLFLLFLFSFSFSFF